MSEGKMDALAIGNFMRDADDVVLIDFVEILQGRLTERELDVWNEAQRDLQRVREARSKALRDWRNQCERERAERERKREEAERPIRLARNYEAACRAVFEDSP